MQVSKKLVIFETKHNKNKQQSIQKFFEKGLGKSYFSKKFFPEKIQQKKSKVK
jgi:hypothetical protein